MTDEPLSAAVSPTYATKKSLRTVAEAVRELATFIEEQLRGVDERCVRSFTTQARFNEAQAEFNRQQRDHVRLLTIACFLNSLGVLAAILLLLVVTR